MELFSLSEEKLIILLQVMNNLDEINYFFTNSYWSKTGIYVKRMRKVSQEWKNWRRFQSSTFDTIARRRLVEDQDTILELTGKIQELQNEINCMIWFQEIFRMSESVPQWKFPRCQ